MIGLIVYVVTCHTGAYYDGGIDQIRVFTTIEAAEKFRDSVQVNCEYECDIWRLVIE